MSTSLATAPGASLVCSVLNTRWPVRAARAAISAVSESRISPTMTMSGSWRSMDRRPAAKVRPAFTLIWVWLIPFMSNSTGSSRVMIFFLLSFSSASMA